MRLACLFALLCLTLEGQPRRITKLYVESFTTNAESRRLRAEVVNALRNQSAISIVTAPASADAILGGGGEIWIRGYRSLNPRSGRLPSDGTPVYSGYLAVELRDKKGATLWSDLVTPQSSSADVAKDLSKRIAKGVAQVLHQGLASPGTDSLPQPAAVLKGAGATFPYPVYAKWFGNYRRANAKVEIQYEAIGSAAGIRKLLAGDVDFGASDDPDVLREIDPGAEPKYLFFPSVAGAVVPIVNLPGLSADIEFTPEALAGIYLGKITKWNDPVLREANRDLHMPDLDIVVVHRADGSGTSYAWTDFLSQISADWKKRVGAGLAPKWPVGRPASGNDGVAKAVKEFGGAIGYVEFIYALQNHLSYGKVRNLNREYVGASLESIDAAVRHSAVLRGDLRGSIVNAPGVGSYPIASFSWFVVPARMADPVKRNALTGFLRWIIGPGQMQAAALGYLALPRELVQREQAVIQLLQ